MRRKYTKEEKQKMYEQATEYRKTMSVTDATKKAGMPQSTFYAMDKKAKSNGNGVEVITYKPTRGPKPGYRHKKKDDKAIVIVSTIDNLAEILGKLQ